MNLLIEEWIPVRPLPTGAMKKISLKELLCGNEAWELCLPRDDMELAAVQLLICMTQVLLTPESPDELKRRIAKPLQSAEYDAAIKSFDDWFQLDHPKYPFMQVKGVSAKKVTSLDKLMAGLTGATSCCFVNEPDLAAKLCAGCASIALFNQATCTPGFGGGFKDPLRGGTPITTLLQGKHLRQTVCLNVLSEDEVMRLISWHSATKGQLPTWMEPIQSETIPAQNIGFARGLFWQPAHVELQPPTVEDSFCSSCGHAVNRFYTGFTAAKFRDYTIKNTWPHPHSPQTTELEQDGAINFSFLSFNLTAPAWTQLNRFVAQVPPQRRKEGYEPAAVVLQSKKLYGLQSKQLHLLVGGYVRKKASIVDRRHDAFTLNHGWDQHVDVINEIVSLGIACKKAVTGAILFFCNGQKDKKTNKIVLKGLGEKNGLTKVAEIQFYRRSEPTIENTLSNIDYKEAAQELTRLRKTLKSIAVDLFDELVSPYRNDPELIRTLAAAKKLVLRKHLNDLEPQQNNGGNNGTTETL